LRAAIRPCSGSCEALDPPTDSCELNLDLRENTEVLVTFHYGHDCIVTVSEGA
jgi:hypothetical protein